ncbi:SDR family NAD(P)-dependent oxidoreductase [Pseudonocardia endophytica]|uniref:NAD(P)-dependent dehydrogenase (Short-subunit alcohol dehydrogenase family) n=1 Tax=Pseudonocardia endophytica TaxID=401976 RepID=A0A4R1HWI4_PSEEN|nr:SDR family NAD(P)-dependent oxidoreductase [Pseudonocardia endophytica]TCK25833.1 NAD(P)-dependent dehydrogenase (short-subunit alcohol dehydrogenase family) [Pseudonocardia endophytica]
MAGDGMLAGKVVLLVGASSGIGADAARLFAAEGATLMLAARSADALAGLTDELTAAGHTAAHVAGDVSVAADVASFVDATLDRFGRLDGAFNNAGANQQGRLDEVSEQDFDRVMAVNVKGTWLCLREQVRAMRASGGAIVNTSSIGGYRGNTGLGAYQATKHAVIGLTRTAAHDNGPLGIRVNAIAPGPTETPMLTHWRASDPDGVARRIAAVPLRKAGTTTEVAEAALWLLSDRAGQVSGVVLPVDGGLTA